MLKVWLITLIFICLSFAFTTTTFAHVAGQPPFFLINGTYAGFYPVFVSSLPNFILPQDSAPENYLINQSLAFELDSAMLPFPPDVIDKTTFSWDFGDGTKAEGLTAKHTYTKIGSFLLTITANYHGYSDPNTKPLLQAVLINIVPNKEYRLPKAVIEINKEVVTNPNNPIEITDRTVTFDAKSSTQGSAKIVSYFWDIGDRQSSNKSQFNHRFSDSMKNYIFPMLRVKDANGFINDAYVELDNSAIQTRPKTIISPFLIIGLINILVIAGVVVFLKGR